MFRFIFLYLVLLTINLFPQSHITFNHLTVEEGLSQSSVTCIFQDSKGFMWFGTQDGLNRYDGYKFKVFKNSTADSSSLKENFIFSIYEDESNRLYIETQSGVLHEFFPRTESFKVISKDSINMKNTRVSTVGALLHEANGVKWTGGLGSGTGLERFDSNTGTTEVFKHDPRDLSSLSSDKVYSVFRDSRGNLWVATTNGLDWLDESTGKFTHYRNNTNDPNSISVNWVWPIFEDSKGNLWVGTVGGGLCKFDYAEGKFINFKNDPNDPTSLNDNFVFSIYEDRGGVIWVGTNLGGINYFHPSTLAFGHFKNYTENSNSLNDNVVYSMLVDKKGNYWIGTRDGGLNKLNYDDLKFTHLKHDPDKQNSLLSNSIQSLLEDKNGTIWVGTFNSGISALNPVTGKISNYTHQTSNTNSLSDNRIYALTEDESGNIWIGTYRGGVNKLNPTTGKITRFVHEEDNKNSISSDAAWSLTFDDSGKLWIGTFGGGINVFNIKKNKLSNFTNDPNDPSSIADNSIIRVFKDNEGTIWIGTTKGLSKYSFEKKSFINYDENDGLSNNFIYGIVQDNDGNLWLSTNDGLSKFNPKDETFSNYYFQDGLQGNEFNQNAFAKDNRTGRILVGGANGFNVFHPDSIKDNKYIPPLVLTDYLRYNTDDAEGKPIYEKGISERDSLSLTYKDNIINVKFSALNFFNNAENQYKYKLEGFNENWIQLGHNRSITLTNLTSGSYKLIIMGSNNDGLWNENEKILFIDLRPPWWKTNIAYFFYLCLLLGALYGVRKFEINRREQKTKIRESELKMKAAEAEKRAIEIENERKTKELEEAKQLQLSMLPKELPELTNIEIAAFMRTATEVGGDYYDVLVKEDGIINIAFGDATGHGLQAGTMVTLMKGFFTSDSTKLGIQDFMNHCNRMIKEIKLGRILMSFSFLKIDNNKLYVSSGGMPPIYFYNSKSEVVEEILMKGMPLGAMSNFNYNIYEKDLNKGDIILMITDGLSEQMNADEEMYGYPRIKDKFFELTEEKPQIIINNLVDSCDKWRNGVIQEDDITFLVIKVK